MAGQPGRSVLGQALGAGVDHELAGHGRADHRGGDDKRDLVGAAAAEADLLAVAEHVGARPLLGDAAPSRPERGRRGTGADDRACGPEPPEARGSGLQGADLVIAGLVAAARLIAVAAVREDADDLETEVNLGSRQLAGTIARPPPALISAIGRLGGTATKNGFAWTKSGTFAFAISGAAWIRSSSSGSSWSHRSSHRALAT